MCAGRAATGVAGEYHMERGHLKANVTAPPRPLPRPPDLLTNKQEVDGSSATICHGCIRAKAQQGDLLLQFAYDRVDTTRRGRNRPSLCSTIVTPPPNVREPVVVVVSSRAPSAPDAPPGGSSIARSAGNLWSKRCPTAEQGDETGANQIPEPGHESLLLQ